MRQTVKRGVQVGKLSLHCMTLADAVAGTTAPTDVIAVQRLLCVPYVNFEGQRQTGHLVVHRELVAEVVEIFQEIAQAAFPIHSILPVVQFGWSDDVSMAMNNTSAFNYRQIVGKPTLSKHAWGRAIDINPRQNPYIKGDTVLPPGAVRDIEAPGTLLETGPVVAAFERRGWAWGGRWNLPQDWHHFQKD